MNGQGPRPEEDSSPQKRCNPIGSVPADGQQDGLRHSITLEEESLEMTLLILSHVTLLGSPLPSHTNNCFPLLHKEDYMDRSSHCI